MCWHLRPTVLGACRQLRALRTSQPDLTCGIIGLSAPGSGGTNLAAAASTRCSKAGFTRCCSPRERRHGSNLPAMWCRPESLGTLGLCMWRPEMESKPGSPLCDRLQCKGDASCQRLRSECGTRLPCAPRYADCSSHTLH